MASGWNPWVWLKCIGVFTGCCYKEIYRFPHSMILLIPTPVNSKASLSLVQCSFFI